MKTTLPTLMLLSIMACSNPQTISNEEYNRYLNLVPADTRAVLTDKEKDKAVMALRLMEHVTLNQKDSVLVIDISKSDAAEMGITADVYDKLLLDITTTNAYMKRMHILPQYQRESGGRLTEM